MTVDIRGKDVLAVVTPYHLRADAPPYARPIVYPFQPPRPAQRRRRTSPGSCYACSRRRSRTTVWRQEECFNLIPSEMTTSPLVRLVSVMDPAFRYAEHRKLEAFYDSDVFYYQGTGFIDEVEQLARGGAVPLPRAAPRPRPGW